MNNLFEKAINLMADGLIITDNNYNIIYINDKSLTDIKNITKINNIIGVNITKIFDDLSLINHQKIFKNKKIKITSKKIIIGDLLYSSLSDVDSDLSFDVTINSFFDNNYIYHSFYFKDNIKSNVDENLKKKQNNFIAFLSHELRNPLQSITLSNYLLKKEINPIYISNSSHKIMSYITVMEKSCRDMKKIINDILDLSKIEANEMCIDLNSCNVKNFIDDLVFLYLDKALLKIIYVNETNIPTFIYTDEIRLSQIMTNLITNAIKYTSNKSTSSIDIIIAYNNITNNMEFSVTDNGNGIRENEINQIFDEGSKTHSNLEINCDSNGLGLCISQKIAKLLGGYISVKSEYKCGSTFTLHHPYNEINISHLKTTDISNNIYNNINGKILLVDDNASNLLLLKIIIEQFKQDMNYDLEIHTAISGYDAIKMCQDTNYNLIFMDINMIGLDGCASCNIIKNEHHITCSIIATTGNILAKQQNAPEKYSCFDDIIIKPFDNHTILEIIQKYFKKI